MIDFKDGTFYGEKKTGVAVVSFAIVFLTMTIGLLLFEIVFFTLVYRLWYTGRGDIWALQCLVIGLYLFGTYATSHSRIFRLVFALIIVVVCSVVLGLIIWINALWTLKILLGSFIAFNSFSIIISIKSNDAVWKRINKKNLLLVIGLSLVFFSSSFIIIFSPNQVEIKPKTNPTIVFWGGSLQIPDDPDVLDMCSKNGIEFVVTVRNKSVGNDEYIQNYKRAINHDVNFHLAIGLSPFYAFIGSLEDLPDIYLRIRDWLRNESVFDSGHLKSFCLDAETPKDYAENFEESDAVQSINYMIDNFPTQEEIDKTEKALQDFTELVRDDRKEAGIVRIAPTLDSVDGDDDMALIGRNVYGLDVEWDYSVSMMYRSGRRTGDDDDMSGTEEVADDFYNFFLGSSTFGTKNVMSLSFFYQQVAVHQQLLDIQVPVDRQLIFVGNFKLEFKNTSYIKNEEWRMDLDICRHFGEEEVWFYDLGGYKYHYGGWDGLMKVIEQKNQDESWMMEYDSENLLRNSIAWGSYVVMDITTNFEEDLL